MRLTFANRGGTLRLPFLEARLIDMHETSPVANWASLNRRTART